VNGLAKDPRGHAEKQLHAEKVDVEFAPSRPGQSVEARKAIAEGHPMLTSRQIPSKGPEQTTQISGDQLVATLGEANALRQLDGTGNTQIVESATDGSRNTTKGDVLHTTFNQEPVQAIPATVKTVAQGKSDGNGKKATQAPRMQTTLETAIQDGNVVLKETPANHPIAPTAGAPGTSAKPGATTQPATLTAWAQHAEYHASDQVLHLTGSPRISDGETMQVAADLIDYHRDTQNSSASGNVKATYTQEQKAGIASKNAAPTMGGSGPVHVIADRATMDHAKNQNIFYGTARAPARMWQDPDSLLAPVIEIDRGQNLLKAWGEGTGSAPVVNTNFASAMGGSQQQKVVRVHSQTLVYSDKTRQGDFHGSVTAEQSDEVVHADDTVLYLKPAPANAKSGPGTAKPVEVAATSPAGSGGPPKQSSQLDHMIATGHVIFTQPGRKGTGEKLIYTADDGKYVLTGTEAALPEMWDRVHGTTTGAALIFNSQDDSVEVSGGKSSAVTETRARK
jgi:lipopolysaccharide export system protein LptA